MKLHLRARRLVVMGRLVAVACLVTVGANAQRTEDLQVERPTTHGFNAFGASSGIHGEWAVVGDPTGNSLLGTQTGSCSVYRRTAEGWELWQVLTPDLNLGNQGFGNQVALLDDELFVGASYGGQDQSGSVHVYRLLNEQWTETQLVRAFDGGHHFQFGSSLACDGETLVVGSRSYHDPLVFGVGTCYVYERSGMEWVLSERIPKPSPRRTPHLIWGGFGEAVAVEGNRLVVGAPAWGQGMAFVYRRGTSGWQWEADLYLPQFSPERRFGLGSSVGLSGRTIAVGAPSDMGEYVSAPSSVWIFEYDPFLQHWGLALGLRASDYSLTHVSDLFGAALVLRGDHLIVGALRGAANGSREGTAYLFTRSGAGWTESERFVASDPNPNPGLHGASFGASIAADITGTRLLIGANNKWSEADQMDSGGAYFFDLNQGSLSCSGSPNETGESTRLTVTGSLDVNDANLSLTVYEGPPGRMGMFLAGPGGPPVPFGLSSFLCVGQPFARLTSVINVGHQGGAMHQVDFSAPSLSSLISPGSTLTFQFIHRDAHFLTNEPTLTASEAREVVFE